METEQRAEFAERLARQVEARFHQTTASVEERSFALRLSAPGISERVALASVYHACSRQPQRTAALIADFVNQLEMRLAPAPPDALAATRVVWCVRSQDYLDNLRRSNELLRREVGGSLVAFAAESLPGSIMRGIPRDRWSGAGLEEADVVAAADRNTAARFVDLVPRIHAADRVPADGWRLSSDVLYQGSVLLVAAVRHALVERAGDRVLLANPDRGLVLALPAGATTADDFQLRVVREWREAMNPASRDIFITDGDSLDVVPRRRGALMPWLSE